MANGQRYRTQAEAAEALGISSQAVGKWMRMEGAPVARHKGKLHCLWPEFPMWRDARRAKPEDQGEADRRRAAAEAEMAEHRLAKMRGELMTLATHEQVMTRVLGTLHTRLAMFAPRWGAGLHATAREVDAVTFQARLDDAVEELKDVLRQPIGGEDA